MPISELVKRSSAIPTFDADFSDWTSLVVENGIIFLGCGSTPDDAVANLIENIAYQLIG